MSGIVSKKLGIREGTRAIFLNAPEAARGAIDPPSLDVASELAGEFDYIHLFARTQAELDDTFPKLMAHLNRFLSQGTVAQVAGFAWIPLDINDFPTRHYYGLGLWQNHIERILAG